MEQTSKSLNTGWPNMRQQILSAQIELCKIKKANPAIFPEYTNLLTAKENLAAAKIEYKRAKEAWKMLGNIAV